MPNSDTQEMERRINMHDLEKNVLFTREKVEIIFEDIALIKAHQFGGIVNGAEVEGQSQRLRTCQKQSNLKFRWVFGVLGFICVSIAGIAFFVIRSGLMKG